MAFNGSNLFSQDFSVPILQLGSNPGSALSASLELATPGSILTDTDVLQPSVPTSEASSSGNSGPYFTAAPSMLASNPSLASMPTELSSVNSQSSDQRQLRRNYERVRQ